MRESQPLGDGVRAPGRTAGTVCVVRMSALRQFLQAACNAAHTCQETPWVVVVGGPALEGQEG